MAAKQAARRTGQGVNLETSADLRASTTPREGAPDSGAAIASKGGELAPLAPTPDQQAALSDLTNGWTRQRVLEALAHTASVEAAAQVAGVSSWTIYRWARTDPEFAERLAHARHRAGERVLTRLYNAVMEAPHDQLVRTPTAAVYLGNVLMPETRPNAGPAIDARSVTVNVLTEEQAQAVARALAGVPDGEPCP